MTEHAIAARLDGDRIAIEVVEVGGEYGEVLNTLYIDAAAAVRFGQGLIRLGRLAKAPAVLSPGYVQESAEGRPLQVQTLLLAVHRDPHAEDGR